MKLFLALICAHVFGDFVFQSDIMAKLKNRHNKPDWIPNHQKYVLCWPYWLTAHAIIHGACLYYVTSSLMCAIIEVIFHWFIDFLKCEGKTNPHEDQVYHIFLKICYWMILS